MKRIPEHLRKEIIRANRKKNRLSKKLIGTISRITDFNFDHIEYKASHDEFLEFLKKDNISEKDVSTKEYAYFYKTFDERNFGCEKIKNGKLKEYYERLLYFKVSSNPFSKKFNGKFSDCLKALEESMTDADILSGFYINNVYYSLQYSSITNKNKIESYYFYSQNKVFCPLNDFFGEEGSIIIRIDNDFKISKIYFYPLEQKYKSKNIANVYYYYNNVSDEHFSEVLFTLINQIR